MEKRLDKIENVGSLATKWAKATIASSKEQFPNSVKFVLVNWKAELLLALKLFFTAKLSKVKKKIAR